jgi:hypothetical protein
MVFHYIITRALTFNGSQGFYYVLKVYLMQKAIKDYEINGKAGHMITR